MEQKEERVITRVIAEISEILLVYEVDKNGVVEITPTNKIQLNVVFDDGKIILLSNDIVKYAETIIQKNAKEE